MSLDKGDNNSNDNPKEIPKLANLKVAEVAEQRDVGRKIARIDPDIAERLNISTVVCSLIQKCRYIITIFDITR
jgi:hypothetical protein